MAHSRINLKLIVNFVTVGGVVASWLVCSTVERAVWVQALAGDIVLCSWARHLRTFARKISKIGFSENFTIKK